MSSRRQVECCLFILPSYRIIHRKVSACLKRRPATCGSVFGGLELAAVPWTAQLPRGAILAGQRRLCIRSTPGRIQSCDLGIRDSCQEHSRLGSAVTARARLKSEGFPDISGGAMDWQLEVSAIFRRTPELEFSLRRDLLPPGLSPMQAKSSTDQGRTVATSVTFDFKVSSN